MNLTKFRINPFFMEFWLLYMSQRTKCVVFQNAKSIVTFDKYLTREHVIQEFKNIIWTKKKNIKSNVSLI